MALEPQTEPGARFVALAEQHIPVLRARAADHDASGAFPAENFSDLKKSGLLGAFAPPELGGLAWTPCTTGRSASSGWRAGTPRPRSRPTCTGPSAAT